METTLHMHEFAFNKPEKKLIGKLINIKFKENIWELN